MGYCRLMVLGSAYITPEGFDVLRDELDHLWRVERPKVTEAVSVAAALGDRSENADYIYGKKRLREIDRRVRFLRKRIDELVVVEPDSEAQAGKVYFGAWVSLEDEDGEANSSEEQEWEEGNKNPQQDQHSNINQRNEENNNTSNKSTS